jgi:hypothetical protein
MLSLVILVIVVFSLALCGLIVMGWTDLSQRLSRLETALRVSPSSGTIPPDTFVISDAEAAALEQEQLRESESRAHRHSGISRSATLRSGSASRSRSSKNILDL